MVKNGRLDSSLLTFICASLKFQNCLNVTSATVELPCNISRTLRQLQMKTYQLSGRIISLSGYMESNSGPINEYTKSIPFISPTNSVCLLY